jgi:hypothetical protein
MERPPLFWEYHLGYDPNMVGMSAQILSICLTLDDKNNHNDMEMRAAMSNWNTKQEAIAVFYGRFLAWANEVTEVARTKTW